MHRNSMSLAVIVSDGASAREFLLRLHEITDGAHVFHNLSDHDLEALAWTPPHDQSMTRMPTYRETIITRSLRAILAYSHMYWADTRSMRRSLSIPLGGT